MSLLDGILAQVNSNADVQNLAAKVGITPEQAESAIMALAKSHTEPGDTVEGAAASTGLAGCALCQASIFAWISSRFRSSAALRGPRSFRMAA